MMSISPVSLQDISLFLQDKLTVNRYPDTEQGGIYYPSTQPIRRLGLALEPFPGLSEWVDEQHLDALWLHRPWRLNLTDLPSDIGILSHHLPFDETLTIGYNELMAIQLGASSIRRAMGYKQAADETGKPLPKRPLGMLIDIPEQEFDSLLHLIKTQFGGYDRAETGITETGWQTSNRCVAVVGAMTDTLVRQAARQGAHLYLTGEYRKPAQSAVDETGIAVVAVGHRRVEEWGLRSLADLLQQGFGIECLIHE